MEREGLSPRVIEISWGRVVVDGFDTPFKDVKLFPGGAVEWDWGETGTRHDPGIQPADVEPLFAYGVTTMILSKGMEERLKTMPETLELLESHGITTHVLETKAAIQLYNELAPHEAVAAVIHSTC